MVLYTSAFRIQALFVLLNISQFSDAAINLNVARPTSLPSSTPSAVPSASPSLKPSASNKPSKVPSKKPTSPPTKTPTNKPTSPPTKTPTKKPTSAPTNPPSPPIPTSPPTTKVPTTSAPTPVPTTYGPTKVIVPSVLPIIPIFDIPNDLCLYVPIPFLFCYLFGEDGRGDELGRSGSTNDVDPSLWEGMWANVTEYLASLEHVVLPGGIQPVDTVQTPTLSPIE